MAGRALQQLGQNVECHPLSFFNIRKSLKKFLPWLCRNFCRNNAGMLILLVFALMAFMTGFFKVIKGTLDMDSEERFLNHIYRVELKPYEVCRENNDLPLPSPNVSAKPIALSFAAALDHPCKHFAFPPPPPGGRPGLGPRPCPVCYIPVEHAIASIPKYPSLSAVLHHLTYFREENSMSFEHPGGSDFGGYPSLQQRNDSFNIKESMTVHCGFIKGCRPGDKTGFDIDEADLTELEHFHEVVVASAIFGKYDLIQQPKDMSEFARRNVPFYMFIDEETEAYMNNASLFDSNRKVGLWRIIVVRNLPYTDARRNGKVPKLLLHRIFPSVHYSIWIDGKLQLVQDPYQILERFLWRHNATFAISRHYRRFDVFEEAEANKAGGKYDNISIDKQIDFYRKEGLTPYSRAKLPITSDVPEGCVIIREHIPITNLFSCLWFNEVDRFTSRDQLSFSTVRDKIMAKVNWTINMFLDCERRNFVVQEYHRDILEKKARLARASSPSTPTLIRNNRDRKTSRKKISNKRGRGGKRQGSKRHRQVAAGNRENALF